jgi:hypothetical protein
MKEVRIEFVLMVGSELVAEASLPDPLPTLGSEAGIDGALRVNIDGHDFLGPRHWDRLDIVLRNLRDALDEALAGDVSSATFPDTRLELKVSPADNSHVTLWLEGNSVDVPALALDKELNECARRLLALQSSFCHTEALKALEERISQQV